MRRVPFLFLLLLFVPRGASPQGAPLGAEFRVNTFTTGHQRDPSIAVDSSGNFVVVWRSFAQDGSGYGVFAQRYDGSGAPVGLEFRVNSHTTDHQLLPAVAGDAVGNFVVVWSSYAQDGSYAGVFGQRYLSSGTPVGPEFRVNTFTTGYQRFPSVASDTTGGFVVVWQSDQTDDPDRGVFGQRYDSSGAPLGPEFRVNTYTTGSQLVPSVAADASDSFVVVWDSTQLDDPDRGIFGQRYSSSGTPLGPEFRVNTFTPFQQNRPTVAADASGNFVVVWASETQDGSYFGVAGQRYASSGASLGPEFRVNTYTTNVQGFTSVAIDPSGNFVVVWSSNSQDGSGLGVFAQRYAGSGTPLGPEFRVNTFTTGQQGYPTVAADSSGNFVVVWSSYGQDGSYFGIFGQRFGQIVPVELMRFGVE